MRAGNWFLYDMIFFRSNFSSQPVEGNVLQTLESNKNNFAVVLKDYFCGIHLRTEIMLDNENIEVLSLFVGNYKK